MDLLLQNLNKKREQGKNKNDYNTTASNEFLNLPAYQSTIERTPPRNNVGLLMMIEASLGLHEVLASEVKNV